MTSVTAVIDIHSINATPSRQSEARTAPATACLCRRFECALQEQYSSLQRDSVERAPRLLAASEKTYQG